jgi:hypothetical protein
MRQPLPVKPCTHLPEAEAKAVTPNEFALIEVGLAYPVWSPDRAFQAADAMLQALAQDEENADQAQS